MSSHDHQSVVVLLSGGLDSVTLLHEIPQHTIRLALSFDYGAKHNTRELACAAWQAEQLGVEHRVVSLAEAFFHIQSSLLRGGAKIPDGHYAECTMRQTVVPFRNGIMLSVAAGIAESSGANVLAIAAHAGDHAIYPDCRAAFVEAMSQAIQVGTYAGLRVACPFLKSVKADLVRRGHKLGVDFKRTWSCYKGGKRHCGTCGTCVERREAFMLADVKDPTDYVSEASLPKAPETGVS